MKKIIKSVFVCLMMLFVGVGLFSCGNDDRLKVGVLQYATHDALDSACDGILEALKKGGYNNDNMKVTIQNPQGDTSSMTAMAKNLVRSSDVIFAIATPAAQAIKAELTLQKKTTPTFFTAVTDAQDAKIVALNDAPGGCISGTSDMNPITEQIDLLVELIPTANKVGILYTSNEDNSRIQANMAKDALVAKEKKVSIKTISAITDVEMTLKALVNTDKCDAIYIPTDNILAAEMKLVKRVALELKTPVIVGEESMVRNGGLATLGINYHNLGILTGEMAIDHLKNGTSISTMKVKKMEVKDMSYFINEDVANELKITIPASLEGATKVKTN